jgi:catalase
LPVAGEHALSAADATKADPNYLMTELPVRIAKGPVKFTLLAQVAEAGDSTTDATMVWPKERKLVTLGTISLTTIPQEQVIAQRKLMFNPLALQPGIEASAHPVLLARPAA